MTHTSMESLPTANETVPTPVLPLQYAMPATLGGAEARSAFRWMFFLTLSSGACVASCFLIFAENFVATTIQMLVFAATIFLAIGSGKALMRMLPAHDDPGRVRRTLLDCVALVGLVMIGLVPFIFQLTRSASVRDFDSPLTGALGIAYALLMLTTARHVMLYQLLAGLCRQINRTAMARGLMILGWTKAVYEFLWLGACAAALLLAAGRDMGLSHEIGDSAIFFAFAALVGLAGFAIIWIWMMVAHAQLLRIAK